eukprot:107546-Alexandrium_andersonii.AAC.1
MRSDAPSVASLLMAVVAGGAAVVSSLSSACPGHGAAKAHLAFGPSSAPRVGARSATGMPAAALPHAAAAAASAALATATAWSATSRRLVASAAMMLQRGRRRATW